MRRIYLEKSDPTVSKLHQITFPSYNGKQFVADLSGKVVFYNTQWDGGSLRTYRIVRLSDMSVCTIAEAPFLQSSELHQKEHVIPDGYVVVVWSQSRWEHIEFIAPPSSINPMLPKTVLLTENEATVLIATRSLVSSYNGISNFRFHEANRLRGIKESDWNEAKQSLIDKKLLNKKGAITVEGKNVCPDTYL